MHEQAHWLRLYIASRIKSIYPGSFTSKMENLRGYDLQEKRRYKLGDDPRAIDKLSSVKEGAFKVSVKKAERAATVYFLIDCSRSLFYGTEGNTKYAYMLNMLNDVARACLGGGNRVRLFTFTDRIEFESGFLSSGQRVNDVFSILKRTAPKHRESDLAKPLKQALGFSQENQFKKPNLIFIASDFLFSDNYIKPLRHLRTLADTVALIVCDETETILRKPRFGAVKLIDQETGNTIIAESAAHPVDKMPQILKRYDIDCLPVHIREPLAANLNNVAILFEKKRK